MIKGVLLFVCGALVGVIGVEASSSGARLDERTGKAETRRRTWPP
jgi:hypothetical protein